MVKNGQFRNRAVALVTHHFFCSRNADWRCNVSCRREDIWDRIWWIV